MVREHFDCLAAKQKLPSYILENSELTELCVRARGDEDWSRDVRLEPKTPEDSSIVIQVGQGSIKCITALSLFLIDSGWHLNSSNAEEVMGNCIRRLGLGLLQPLPSQAAAFLDQSLYFFGPRLYLPHRGESLSSKRF